MNDKKTYRPDVLENAPLRYAPTNELGVVFLFAHLARRWRLKIDSIQPGYPDCIAFQKVSGCERRIRIEFEFRSRNFRTQGHDPSKCDWIVCWEHNWSEVPKHLHVVELRREFGLGFNVWIMPTNDPYKKVLEKVESVAEWSLPSQCHQGDLVLFYFTRPEQSIHHVFIARERAFKSPADWKEGDDYGGVVRRVCRLKAPIFMEDLQRHRVLRTAGFVRSQMQGRPCATEYWPFLYDLIVQRNPSVKDKLRRFAPENI